AMTNPSAGHDPALPADKLKRPLADIHLDTIHLAGVLHILDNFDPIDIKGKNGRAGLIAVCEEMAQRVADDLEAWV
ncbi:MAG TPA: hypothetical protein VM899_13590, partial [Rubellimicrobium sp.]|nr:hypothetical protein [Rubellimicrobium sp.]